MGVIRLLVTGSRMWPGARTDTVHEALEAAVAFLAAGGPAHPVTLVSGTCPSGVDAIAEAYAAQVGWTVERHAAVWDECGEDCPDKPHQIRRRPGDTAHPGVADTYCPKAGPRRNTLMVSLGADLAVGFPLGTRWSGTRDCIAKAKRAGIITVVHEGGTDA